jgi:hypothetical protein
MPATSGIFPGSLTIAPFPDHRKHVAAFLSFRSISASSIRSPGIILPALSLPTFEAAGRPRHGELTKDVARLRACLIVGFANHLLERYRIFEYNNSIYNKYEFA